MFAKTFTGFVESGPNSVLQFFFAVTLKGGSLFGGLSPRRPSLITTSCMN